MTTKILFLLLLVCSALFTGCGGTRGDRVWGQVTLDGKPVQIGSIYFTPQEAAGPLNEGFAKIDGGYYDTADDGRNIFPGTYQVRVLGYDGQGIDSEHPNGQLLFDHRIDRVELKSGGREFNINVPLQPAK